MGYRIIAHAPIDMSVPFTFTLSDAGQTGVSYSFNWITVPTPLDASGYVGIGGLFQWYSNPTTLVGVPTGQIGQIHYASGGDDVSISVTGIADGRPTGFQNISVSGIQIILPAPITVSEWPFTWTVLTPQQLSGNDSIEGTFMMGDTLLGHAGNDTLVGGGGPDLLSGGPGDDTYRALSGEATVVEDPAQGIDFVQLWVPDTGSGSYTLPANVEHLELGESADGLRFDASGNGEANRISGNIAANLLRGLGGDDTLAGGGGLDTLEGGAGADLFVIPRAPLFAFLISVGPSWSNLVTITDYSGHLQGGGDLIWLDAFTSSGLTRNGTLGAAQFVQGDLQAAQTAAQRIVYDNVAGDVYYDADGVGGTAAVRILSFSAPGASPALDAADFTVFHARGLTINGNSSSESLTGTAEDDTLRGNLGNDTLSGGPGADLLNGGYGSDVYLVDEAGDHVIEPGVFGGGTDEVRSVNSYTLGAYLERLILLGNASLEGTGNELANFLGGNASDNVLDGGRGRDTMAGGAGNDTYILDMAAESVTELANAGFDTVRTSISYTLAVNLERLELTDSASVNGTGNALANTLAGNEGSNLLNGLGGIDIYVGSDGNDSYLITQAGDTISGADAGSDTVLVALATSPFLNLSVRPDLENVTYTGGGAVTITGNGEDNALKGNAGNDSLVGSLGDDTLDGRGGVDTMLGGDGNDTYVVNSALDLVNETGADAADTLVIGTSFVLPALSPIENVTLSGTAALNATGNGIANVLTGNAGANVLNGGAGADTMVGGAGSDTYVVDNTLDAVTETMMGTAGGIDLVQSAVDFSLVGTRIENATLTAGPGDSLTGNELANRLTGAGNNDTLIGGGGKDTMIGGPGDDSYAIDMVGETVTEALNAGVDTIRTSVSYTLGLNVEHLELTAGAGNLNGTGNTLANTLTGNEADNVLNGAAGIDVLTGGAGADRFLLALAPGAANVDTITDFEIGVDRIAVDKDIFAGLSVGALSMSAFAAGPGVIAALDASDRFVYDASTGNLYYDAGGNAGAAPVLMATLTGAPALTAASFEVVL